MMGTAMGEQKTQSVQELPLKGARVLIVEDEYYIADDLRRTLNAAGAKVVGPVSTIAKATDAIDLGDFDCAVIDLNLHGESALPIADRLVSEGRSFAIATGYGSSVVPDRLREVPRIEKPFDPRALLEVVKRLSCSKAGARAG
jgi:DNA-binding response OmpR family regulator